METLTEQQIEAIKRVVKTGQQQLLSPDETNHMMDWIKQLRAQAFPDMVSDPPQEEGDE